MSAPKRVIIVGGGLAGLAAAIQAADDGAQVDLYERAPRLGGATWSFTRDGLSYDNGQHVFMRCCNEYRSFLERIGSAGQVTLQERMDVPVHSPKGSPSHLRRVALPSPLHLGPSLARYSHLSLRDRAGVVRAALALKRLDLNDPHLDQQSFAEWLGEHGASNRAVEALWGLVCLPTVNLSADNASLALAAKVFKTGLLDQADGADIGWANVPLQELHGDAACRTLEGIGARVHTKTHVERVHQADDGTLEVQVDGEARSADAVVVAVPHEAVATLLPAQSFATQARVADLGRSPIVNVHLLYDRHVIDDPFVAGIDSPVQFVFDRTGSSGAPADQQFLAISLSAADKYLSWSSDELVDYFGTEMKRLFPAARSASVVTSMVTRDVAATFRGSPGTASLRPGVQTAMPGVFIAGAWTDTGWPATMEGAVRSGNRAAAAVKAHMKSPSSSRPGVAA